MFGALASLRSKAIPSRESLTIPKGSYRDWPVAEGADLFREPLVEASDFGLSGRNYYAHDRNPPYWAPAPGAIDKLLMRESVARRLQGVDGRLRDQGLCLHLYDAWRPRAVQNYFHNVWMPNELKRRWPDMTDAEMKAGVGQYWAAPTEDPKRPAPHATGAAVDLTIAMVDGPPLWMGSLFDDASPLAETDLFEPPHAQAFSFSHDEAMANRRLLYWLMADAGFSNFRNEWWHFSWGDQMWAQATGAPHAHYGLARPPPGYE